MRLDEIKGLANPHNHPEVPGTSLETDSSSF